MRLRKPLVLSPQAIKAGAILELANIPPRTLTPGPGQGVPMINTPSKANTAGPGPGQGMVEALINVSKAKPKDEAPAPPTSHHKLIKRPPKKRKGDG